MLHTYFDRIFVINLDNRTDKWEDMSRRLALLGIENIERFSAVQRPLSGFPQSFYTDMNLSRIKPEDVERYLANASGCKQSHLDILKKALREGDEKILILEDDCIFSDDAMEVFTAAWQELQGTDWRMLYLGGMHKKRTPPQPFSRHLLRLAGTYETHAYAVARRAFEPLVAALERSGEEVDVIYARRIHPYYPCFSTNPTIAFQDDTPSDIVQQRIKAKKKPRCHVAWQSLWQRLKNLTKRL